MNKTILNINGEIFDVTYNQKDKPVAKSRKDKKEYEASCIYTLMIVIKELNS